jgi:hypothetical protein
LQIQNSFARKLLAASLPLVILAQCISISPTFAVTGGSDDSGPSPSGTMLLPLTPKLDTAPPAAQQTEEKAEIDATSTQSAGKPIADSEDLLPTLGTIAPESGNVQTGNVDDEEATPADKLLKGTVQIVADDTEFDQDNNTFLGTGNAVAIIGGQNSKLQADTILYDQNSQIMDARGNVRILRGGQLTTGSSFKFKINSDEYLITKPDTELQGSEIIARKGYGSKNGLAFKNGTISGSTPFYYSKYWNVGPMSYREESNDKRNHPDAYLPNKQTFHFRAKKIVYERYKEQGNLTVIGGHIQVGSFSIPTGRITMTIGEQDTRPVFPILPYAGSNFNMGGTAIGPSFQTGIGRTGILSWAPLLQINGTNYNNGGANVSGLGVGARVGFSNATWQGHIAYGSVSNMLVADLKGKIWKSLRWQSGINRFLNDGMFGNVRARYAAEVVDNHQYTHIPYLQFLMFRTSAGEYQDNPQLINISSNYAKLFGSAAQSAANSTKTVYNTAGKVQEQISAATMPFFNVGDDKWGVKSYLFGSAAARAYTTGDSNVVIQGGPVLDLHLNKIRGMLGYNKSAVRGNSPFVFDAFLQGTQSVYAQGDVKLSKYVAVGGYVGYILDTHNFYGKMVNLAVGPQDCKLLVSRDFIFNRYRVGFDMLYGAPVNYNKLVLKGQADQGQLGGI